LTLTGLVHNWKPKPLSHPEPGKKSNATSFHIKVLAVHPSAGEVTFDSCGGDSVGSKPAQTLIFQMVDLLDFLVILAALWGKSRNRA
jgi:hypothetical protein